MKYSFFINNSTDTYVRITYNNRSILLCITILLNMYAIMPVYARFHRSYTTHTPHQHIVVLDPAGDAQTPGRPIGDTFERGITTQCVEALQTILTTQYQDLLVLSTRIPGESIAPLQNANFTNRLAADLFIHISCYAEHDIKPIILLYRFSYGNDYIKPSTSLTFYRYDQAYVINKTRTISWAHHLKQILEQQSICTIRGVYALPCKPLIGIIAPAYTIELGIPAHTDWHIFVEPLANALIELIKIL